MKKSLRPQQTAPVQRQTTATANSPVAVGGVAAAESGVKYGGPPFAGDDAE